MLCVGDRALAHAIGREHVDVVAEGSRLHEQIAQRANSVLEREHALAEYLDFDDLERPTRPQELRLDARGFRGNSSSSDRARSHAAWDPTATADAE